MDTSSMTVTEVGFSIPISVVAAKPALGKLANSRASGESALKAPVIVNIR
jgi:hypothetical protein